MSRECCAVCLRAKVGCICHLFTRIDNSTHVVILQHPNEVKQTKGTVTLIANSLSRCEVIVGEDFTNNALLDEVFSVYKDEIALLYPSETAIVLAPPNDLGTLPTNAEFSSTTKPLKCIILIDGTWKKSYKMYKLNEVLHTIPHITLPNNVEGDYRIRKTQKEHALSSLEACTYALMSLEVNTEKYKPLLNSFKLFNDLQLSFNPNH